MSAVKNVPLDSQRFLIAITIVVILNVLLQAHCLSIAVSEFCSMGASVGGFMGIWIHADIHKQKVWDKYDTIISKKCNTYNYLCYYNVMKCDIEIFHHNQWYLAASFEVNEQEVGNGYKGKGFLAYDTYYAVDHLDAKGCEAVSCGYPVNLNFHRLISWPAFLLDLLPTGAGRRSLLNQFNLHERGPKSDWLLLLKGAGNPPGNLRIRQAVENFPLNAQHEGYTLQEIIERREDFIEYARGHGAPVAGSSGVQGDAPKFLLTQDGEGRWHADGALADAQAKQHWLIKFPRGHLKSDYAVLRNEYAYYKVAKAAGLRVHAIPKYQNNTLIIPRFDRQVKNNQVIRYGQESLCSLADVSDFGYAIPLEQLCGALIKHVSDPKRELLEFLYRDILNVALGNTDNHARNTAVRKFTGGFVELTPIYDFAPMILDEQGIARICRWSGVDNGGNPDWGGVVKLLSQKLVKCDITEVWLRKNVYAFSDKVEQLPEIMRQAEVDDDLIKRLAPRIQNVLASLRSLKVGR